MRRREPIAVADIAGLRWCDPVSWVVAAALTVVSLPFLIARDGGRAATESGPQAGRPGPGGDRARGGRGRGGGVVLVVAALAAGRARADPGGLAVPPAAAQAAAPGAGSRAPGPVLRVLTLNVKGGAADAEAITRHRGRPGGGHPRGPGTDRGAGAAAGPQRAGGHPAAQSPRPAGGLTRHRAVGPLAADPAGSGRGRCARPLPGRASTRPAARRSPSPPCTRSRR